MTPHEDKIAKVWPDQNQCSGDQIIADTNMGFHHQFSQQLTHCVSTVSLSNSFIFRQNVTVTKGLLLICFVSLSFSRKSLSDPSRILVTAELSENMILILRLANLNPYLQNKYCINYITARPGTIQKRT